MTGETGTTTAARRPGPRSPALVQSLLSLAAPSYVYPRWLRRFGDRFEQSFVDSSDRVVIVSGREAVREVFAGPTSVFHAGKGNEILRPLLGGHSLLLQDGDEHARARRLLMPVFGRREIAGYRTLVEEVTDACLLGWPASGRVRAHELLNGLTLEVILRVVFGVTDPARLGRLRPLVTRVVESGPVVMVGLGIPALHRVDPWRRTLRDLADIRGRLAEQLEDARRDPSLDDRTDLLARLVRAALDDPDGLTDTELVDQLVTMVAAGHETTATAVSWALLELARRPDLQERCLDPVEGPDLRGAVLKESLRLHPVVPLVMRELVEPATVAGTGYPAGVALSPNILLAHRDPERFPEPAEFRPERFLADEPPSPVDWMPFGGGVRRCIGASFALMEGEVVLRRVLERYRLGPVGSGREWPRSRNVTLYPWRRARLVLTPR